MKFFDRDIEVRELRKIREISHETARFTVLTGRRRVGKTELVKQAYSDEPYIYFYVARKTQVNLCEEFKEITEKILGRAVPGRIERFSELFRFICEEAVVRPITLVIDEFQDFIKVDESIFSEMSRDWDEFHGRAKLNLVVSGSINRLMNQIFEDREAPLYGRNTGRIKLAPFSVPVMKEILTFYNPSYENEDLLALWTFTGGVARYVSLLMDAKAVTKDGMIAEIVRPNSSFFDEGKIVLTEEFGKDYATYFTILSAIAAGKTSRDRIETACGGEVSGYLTKLEHHYGLIAKKQPLFEPNERKNCLYRIDDCFFRFWFRFIFKYGYLLEVEMFDELRGIVERDYEVFSGQALEDYFRQKSIGERLYSRLGGWWDRKGENEIDCIGENEFLDTLEFVEIKRDVDRIKLDALRTKADAFFEKNPEKCSRMVSYRAFSIKDM